MIDLTCSFGYCVHAAQKWLQPTIHHSVTAAQIFLGRVAFRVADSTLPRICSSAQRAACSVAAAIGTLSPGATSWFDNFVPLVILPWPATCPHLLPTPLSFSKYPSSHDFNVLDRTLPALLPCLSRSDRHCRTHQTRKLTGTSASVTCEPTRGGNSCHAVCPSHFHGLDSFGARASSTSTSTSNPVASPPATAPMLIHDHA